MFKKVRARYWSTLLVIFLFIVLSTTSIAAQNTKQVLHTLQDTILIASEPLYPPFCIVDEDGNADGFSVDLIKAVAEVMHLNIQIKVGPWAEIKQELVEGKIDALPLVGRSPEREEVYDFTFPYHTMNGAVFIRKGTKGIETLGDLKQKDIAVMHGDNAQEFVTRVKLSDKIHTTENYDVAFQELSEGKYDAVIAQELMGLQLVNELNINNVQALHIELKGFSQDFSFAVQEGDKELLSVLNEGLSIIVANGTFDELHKKWWSPITLSGLSIKEKITMLLPYIISIIILIALISIVILNLQVKRRTRKLRNEITERKQVEETLRISNENTKKILEKTPFGVIVIGRDRKIMMVNNAALEMVGVQNSETILGKNCETYLCPSQQYDCPILDKGQQIDNSERILRRNDGKEIPIIKTVTEIHLDGEDVLLETFVDITERKQAEEVLQKTYARHSAMIENIGDVIAILGADGMTKYQSPNIEKWFGWKPEDIIGTNGWDKMHPEDIERIQKEFSKVLEKETASTVEYRFICKDGNYKWIEVTAVNRINDPVINGVLLNYHDITERKQAIEEIEKLAKFPDENPNPILRFSKDGIILYHNKGSELLLDQWQYQEGKPPPEKRFRLVRESFENNEVKTEETEIDDKVFSLTFAPIIEKGFVNVYGLDITVRKQAEEALKESEEEFRILYNNSPDMYVSVSPDDASIMFCNDTLLKKTGYSREEIVGSPVFKMYHDDCMDDVKEAFKQFVEIGEVRDKELLLKRKDGSTIIASLNVSSVKDENGKILHSISSWRDITERKQAEEELKINRERLKTAHSILRHDITNDLTVIKSAVDIYREERDESMIDEIEKRVWKSIETIQNQRDQVQFLDSHADLDEYDLKEVMQKVLSNYPDLKITVTGNCVTYADNAIYSVFDNIVNNAVKHGKTSKMDIEIIPNKEHCEIRFKDYGIGVPDEIKDKIFNEGFHYGKTGHTGIGLYIVQTTVEEYGGEVFLEDNEPNGAVFIIRLKKAIERNRNMGE
jgi:PAS domain S-box-containing protein